MNTAKPKKENPQPDTTPGIFSWNELMTRDTAASAKFYSQLFGWKAESMSMGPGKEYTFFKMGERPVGGMLLQPPEAAAAPTSWLGYVTVPDLRKAVAKAKKLGAKICKDVTPIPGMGSFAIMLDPQGAALGLWEFAKK